MIYIVIHAVLDDFNNHTDSMRKNLIPVFAYNFNREPMSRAIIYSMGELYCLGFSIAWTERAMDVTGRRRMVEGVSGSRACCS